MLRIRKLAGVVLCLYVCLLTPGVWAAEGATLSLNASSFKQGERIEISLSADPSVLGTAALDAYLVLVTPEETVLFYTAEGALSASATALLQTWTPTRVYATTFFSLAVPASAPVGEYVFYLILTPAGTDVYARDAWVGVNAASFSISAATSTDTSTDGDKDGSVTTGEADGGTPSIEYTTDTTTDDVREPTSPTAPITSDGDDIGIAPPPDDGNGTVEAGVLTAGDVDDNLNFSFFLQYLSRTLTAQTGSVYPQVTLSDRITLRIVNEEAKAISHARVKVEAEQAQSALVDGYAGSDGVFRLFPTFDGAREGETLTLTVSDPDGQSASTQLSITVGAAGQTGTTTVTLRGAVAERPYAMDLMFVVDTTGSMGDELDYLTVEFRTIVGAVAQDYPNVDMRFSLILYRDEGDAYVVRSFPFAASVGIMQERLDEQQARGGGDYPEAMEQALEEGLAQAWRTGNVARLLFLVADAPPHDENVSATLTQMQAARKAGIRIHSLAASGVGDLAEYVMRIGACITQGRYLFLTDDSGVGSTHAEPNLPGYVVTKLDALLRRVIASELAGERVEATADEIIRTVGTCTNGVCDSDTPQTTDPQQQ